MKRELEAIAARYALDGDRVAKLEDLLAALATEPDPPTTVRAGPAAANTHVADSLSGLEVEELSAARKIVDMGSGAGFPGLALAAVLPASRVDLVEASGRKAELIARLAQAAGIGNTRAIPERLEDWARAGSDYDAATARAVAALPVLVEYAAPLLRLGGILVAWKGARDVDEETAGAHAAGLVGLEAHSVRPVVPFAGSRERNLYVYLKIRSTPERFPRRAGRAAKRPLR